MAIDLDFERTLHQTARTVPVEDDLFTTFADKVLRRVDEVIESRRCKWTPRHGHIRLLQLLRSHQGKSRAVSLESLARTMNFTPRELKDIVQDLRLNFGVQLGASRDSEAGGYYLVATEEESIESTAQMLHQATSMLRVVAAMRGGREVIDNLLHQLRLDLSQEGQS
ncbi:hypothetical protein FTO74_14235 [Granulicella sp. WH15]|uniref:hypothetical protein n=1 Tax=Granulicella sp. WH15 TaxID=2602070 RepID=UPI00136799F4|nr:hypothetical protein [Granulicella sp. WH15]QHN04390.1 hypothetical protein FTO74_14235 [Granulicella sp. WH15]